MPKKCIKPVSDLSWEFVTKKKLKVTKKVNKSMTAEICMSA